MSAFSGASVIWGVAAVWTASAISGASEAQAREAGITKTSCTGCHASNAAELQVSFEPQTVNPGETIAVSVKVSGTGMKAGGIAAQFPEGGEFVLPPDESLSVSGWWLIHSAPKPATDGSVEFHFSWVTPSEPGAGSYNIAVLAANFDGRPGGDSTAVTSGRLAYGCEPVTLYRDTDADGVGATAQFLVDCAGAPGFAEVDGDCDDGNAMLYPGAPELCNELDDDCDGEVDEEVVDLTYYSDEDADGYGYAEEAITACAPVAGYVSNALDCHWLSANIHPDAEEVCDLVDNNCDGAIDEGLDVYCGVGECRNRAELCNLLCVPGEPSAELCNGLDDDCDGQVDDECAAGGAEPMVSVAPSAPGAEPNVDPSADPSEPSAGTAASSAVTALGDDEPAPSAPTQPDTDPTDESDEAATTDGADPALESPPRNTTSPRDPEPDAPTSAAVRSDDSTNSGGCAVRPPSVHFTGSLFHCCLGLLVTSLGLVRTFSVARRRQPQR